MDGGGGCVGQAWRVVRTREARNETEGKMVMGYVFSHHLILGVHTFRGYRLPNRHPQICFVGQP